MIKPNPAIKTKQKDKRPTLPKTTLDLTISAETHQDGKFPFPGKENDRAKKSEGKRVQHDILVSHGPRLPRSLVQRNPLSLVSGYRR